MPDIRYIDIVNATFAGTNGSKKGRAMAKKKLDPKWQQYRVAAEAARSAEDAANAANTIESHEFACRCHQEAAECLEFADPHVRTDPENLYRERLEQHECQAGNHWDAMRRLGYRG